MKEKFLPALSQYKVMISHIRKRFPWILFSLFSSFFAKPEPLDETFNNEH